MLPMGTTGAIAAAGGTATLLVNVQRAMQLERLILASDDLSLVRITDISIATVSQFNANEDAPASAFQRDAVGGNLILDECRTGTEVEIVFRNDDPLVAHDVSGIFFGPSAQ